MSYEHLLAPFMLRGKVFRNHILSTCCLPHFLQGPETFPSESVMRFVENMAKAGPAIVTIPDRFDNTRDFPMEDVKRGPCWDPQDPSVDNYLSQLAESVHFQGALFSVQLSKFHSLPKDAGVSEGPAGPREAFFGGGGMLRPATKEELRALIEEISSRCAYYKSLGFDAVCLHMAYNYNVIARFLSADTNHRTDEYGGSLENRARFCLELFREIRRVCGEELIIEVQISGDSVPMEEFVEYARMCEGLVDIFQIRMMDMDGSHATAYNYDGKSLLPQVAYAEALMKAGVKILPVLGGGFHDPDLDEQLLAEGRCGAVAMARPFICDNAWLRKLTGGRKDDIIPCLHCNKCHAHVPGQWLSQCAVNPTVGIAHRLGSMIDPPLEGKKNVAVVGGGPAGMRAALFAAGRGHSVTLYEKSEVLGGQLKHADYPAFKWAVRDYKDYLIRQLEKNENITVLTGTAATPEAIRAEGYDAVILALGSEPKTPPVSGAETLTRPWKPIEVYGHEAELGKRIVIVGGSESGTETGMYLAECGHEVTVLTRQDMLAKESNNVHYYALVQRRWEANPNFTGITEAETLSVSDGAVVYRDAQGEHTIACDDVVLSGGVRSLDKEALAFAGCARQVLTAGDCVKPGGIYNCNRTALAAASKI